MAIKSIFSRPIPFHSLFPSLASQFHNSKPCVFTRGFALPSTPEQDRIPAPHSLSEDINEICRALSDNRDPHHDLESRLTNFSTRISQNLVEQVLKRCSNLGFSAHRFFIWARTIKGFEHSTESYQILLDVLGRSKQFPLLWDFLVMMRDSNSSAIRRELFWVVFRAYSRANLPGDAIRAFTRMCEFGIRPAIDDLDQLLYILCKRKHVKHAHEFFDRVKLDYPPGVKCYSILMRGWGDIGKSDEAQNLFDEMLERGCEADVLAYNSFLEALCKGGKRNEAYDIFMEMGSRGLNPDACSYSIFIRASCEANDLHTVFRMHDRMTRYGLAPNVFTYNLIIKTLCRNDMVDEAYQLLEEMMERGVNPDVWSYNAIMAFHCDHNEVNRALKLFPRMDKNNCIPDRHTYNMVLKMLIRVGRFDRVKELWESMEERGFYPSVSTYAVMIHGLCKKRGKVEEACKYFEMMIDEGIPSYSSTVEVLRNRLVGFGLLDRVQILADKMERSTSCSIHELANMMRGNRASCMRSRAKDSELETDWEEEV